LRFLCGIELLNPVIHRWRSRTTSKECYKKTKKRMNLPKKIAQKTQRNPHCYANENSLYLSNLKKYVSHILQIQLARG